MFDFSGDEGFCMLVALAISISGAIRLYVPLLRMPLLGRSAIRRVILAMFPVLILLLTTMVLSRWSDPQVAGHADYIILFLVIQAAWMTVACEGIRLFGIGFRDDLIERNNPAAMIAVCGFVTAAAIVFALANVGGGPTIWTTILPAGAGTAILCVLWLTVQFVGGSVAESITIDRDVATGLRVAGAMIGCSLVLGRAVGGNWKSWDQTWTDLALLGWPAIFLAIAAAVLHRFQKPSVANPRPGLFLCGVLPAILLPLGGLLIVCFTPQGMNPSSW